MIGSQVVENMFNSTEIDDMALAETCYNVAICNRYLGYECYNKTLGIVIKRLSAISTLRGMVIKKLSSRNMCFWEESRFLF